MKRHAKHCLSLLALLMSSAAALASTELSADQIMKNNFFSSKVKALEKNVTLTLTDEQGATRERRIHAISVLTQNGIDSRLLVRIVAPADVKGIGFLKNEHLDGEDDQWIFLPALHKSRRLVSNNKKDSFMGTDFAYGDILPPKETLYQNKLIGSEMVDGIDCYIIESIAADDKVRREYDYAKKVQWIAKSNFHEVKIVYYDLGGKLLKTQSIKGITLMDKDDDRWAATSREMVNHQTKHKSTFVANSAKAGVTVPSTTFTLRNLESE
jgi:hypothetical protein